MKWTLPFCLGCLVAITFTGQADAKMRLMPANGETGASQDEAGGCSGGRNGGGGGGRENPEAGTNTGGNPIEQIVDDLFRRFDADRSHTLSVQEAPRWLKSRFRQIDTNRDGQIDPREMMQMILRYRGEQRPNNQPPEQPRRTNNGIAPRY